MIPVTVLVRTLNAEPYLPELLDRILEQEHPVEELLVVDSGSTDRTVGLVEKAGARVLRIAPAEFTHARSTNLGFREARGDVVAMLSQDALPVDDSWLGNLVGPLADPSTAAAFGRQIARPGCFPLERWELERAYPDGPQPGVVYSNVNSAARRSAWEERPFDESLLIAEDRTWAHAAIGAGRRIAYAPDAAVYHSHSYTLRGVYARCRAEAAARRDAEGVTEGWNLLLKGWPRRTLRDARRLRNEGDFLLWPRAAAYRFAQLAGMVAGGRG